MGLCTKNKARSPSRREKPVEIEPAAGAAAAAAPPAAAAAAEEEAAEAVAKEPILEEELHAAPQRQGDEQTVECEETTVLVVEGPAPATAAAAAAAAAAVTAIAAEAAAVDAAVEKPPSRREVEASIHGNPPPLRNDSAATSCAGLTDADGLSRPGTLQLDGEKEKEKAAGEGERETETEQQQQQQQQQQSAANNGEADVNEEASTPAREAAAEAAKREEEKDEGAAATSSAAGAAAEFTMTVQRTFSSLKESLSRSYMSLRSFTESREEAPANNNNNDSSNSSSNSSSNGNSSSSSSGGGVLPAAEQCVCGVLNDLTELGEKALPCVLGENSDSETEIPAGAVPLPPPQITMIVNTPGGAYLRVIPQELVQDAIDMGFISQEEVNKQKQLWEDKWGGLRIQYSPATSFAHQDVKV